MTDSILTQETPEFNQNIALKLFNAPDTDYPVDFDLAQAWLGHSRKDNAKDSFLRLNFVEGLDYCVSDEKISERPGRPAYSMFLSVECFKTWAMMARTPQGNTIRRYFLQCEKIAKKQTETQLATLSSEVQRLTNQLDTNIELVATHSIAITKVEEKTLQLRANFEKTDESVDSLRKMKQWMLERLEQYGLDFKQEQEYFDDLCERVSKLEKGGTKTPTRKRRSPAKKTTKNAAASTNE